MRPIEPTDESIGLPDSSRWRPAETGQELTSPTVAERPGADLGPESGGHRLPTGGTRKTAAIHMV
jgi:hypothetical protein